ncbi:MAG: carbohydrate ABC transporter permease [Bacilli bacterium]|nr:carbohydrate ABC transporter permease [Bacilli bacterium]MBN2877858.1 carbohydrate ABC transporter permease [Bacilli bacterium]
MKLFKNIKAFIKDTIALFKQKQYKEIRHKFKRLFVGMKFMDGLLFKILIYTLLISLGYIYLYPILYMLTNSFMTMADIIDVSVKWIPSSLNWENYQLVWEAINYPSALLNAFILSIFPALSATVSSAIIGYGFARFNFPLKKLLFVLMIMTFIIPPQITMLPTFRMYSQYNLLGSLKAFIYPAILGQGLNGAIFILIFYQFFRMIPKSLEESAQLDGASHLQVFLKIAIPLAVPSIIIVFLFSFVWYYNETYLSGLFLRGSDLLTLPLRVDQYINNYTSIYPEGSRARELMQAVKLAGNVLTILPLLIIYFFTQRYFVESIDRTGITGE